MMFSVFFLVFTLLVSGKVKPSPVVEPRQVIPQRPAFLTISSGAYSDYTLLKIENGTSNGTTGGTLNVLTAGSALNYTDQNLPANVLQGEFRDVDDNQFVPGNRGIRRPFESWAIGIVIVGDRCLKASLVEPYVTLANCQQGTLNDTSLTWVNWGPYLERGLGGYIQPYGNQSAEAFISGNMPGPGDSWGFEQNQQWRSDGQPVVMSTVQGSHLTVVFYDSFGIVPNQTVGF